jgi:hypothetical protein
MGEIRDILLGRGERASFYYNVARPRPLLLLMRLVKNVKLSVTGRGGP